MILGPLSSVGAVAGAVGTGAVGTGTGGAGGVTDTGGVGRVGAGSRAGALLGAGAGKRRRHRRRHHAGAAERTRRGLSGGCGHGGCRQHCPGGRLRRRLDHRGRQLGRRVCGEATRQRHLRHRHRRRLDTAAQHQHIELLGAAGKRHAQRPQHFQAHMQAAALAVALRRGQRRGADSAGTPARLRRVAQTALAVTEPQVLRIVAGLESQARQKPHRQALALAGEEFGFDHGIGRHAADHHWPRRSGAQQRQQR